MSLKENIGYFKFFYKELGYRMLVGWGLTLIVAVLDGFGISMFLPLLHVVSGGEFSENGSFGGLKFLIDFFTRLNIDLTLIPVLLIIMVFFLSKGLVFYINSYYNVIVRLFFLRSLRFGYINGLSDIRYKAFVEKDVGKIQNSLAPEVSRVVGSYVAFMNAMQSWVMLLVYVALAFIADSQFALFILIGGVLSNLGYRQVFKITKKASKRVTRGTHVFQRHLLEIVAHFKYMKATAVVKPYSDKLKSTILTIEQSQKKIGTYNSLLGAVKEPINIVVIVSIILLQVSLFSNNLSAILLSLLFFYRALGAIVTLQTSWNTFLNNSGSLNNLIEFSAEIKKDKEIDGNIKIDGFKTEIKLNAVGLNYGEQSVINNLDLTIKKNTTVAFVGESGSGKTTLLNIITGLLPVDKGVVTIDREDYTTLNKASFRTQVGYITQDPVILSDTIFNNVTLWSERTKETESRFWAALERASVAEFVSSLPKKEDSPLGNNGIQLSGGQKQRISIARELYKDVDILILDEATSSLDSETEIAIQNNLEQLKGQYTFIIVAHRLSTIRKADQIHVVNKGRILDSGTYNELLISSTDFKRMTQLQEI